MIRNIRSPFSGALYMKRTYLWGAPYMIDGTSPFDEFGGVREDAERTPGTQCFKHTIQASDDRSAVHNHPWDWGVSLILWHGYIEERYFSVFKDAAQFLCTHEAQDLSAYADGWIVRHRVRPGNIVHLTHDTFHRVELINGKPAHTLFLAGPIRSGWGFLMPSGEFIKAREYLRPVADGEVTT
jgi:hypothetical protein